MALPVIFWQESSFLIRQIVFKIFYQQTAGDLSTLPASLRGGLSGSGSVTAEIQIVKQGDFSKAEVEQMVEALPAFAGAKYDAQLSRKECFEEHDELPHGGTSGQLREDLAT